MASKKTRQAAVKGGKASTGLATDLDRLESVLQLMKSNGVVELEWETAHERIHLKTAGSLSGAQLQAISLGNSSPAPLAQQHVVAPVSPSVSPAKGPTGNQKQVLSPFVGTFYRAASPEAQPYVREGQTIKKGDVLCIIEAMKLMNQIESEVVGRVVGVLVENGQPVEFGEPLFLIEGA